MDATEQLVDSFYQQLCLSTPTTIHYLPPELIHHILFLASNDYETFADERVKLLSSTSLVCRDWCYPSQRLLRRDVVVDSRERASAIVESGMLGSYGVASVDIFGMEEGDLRADTAKELVRQLPGVRRLEISCFGGDTTPDSIPSDFLSVASLVDLRYLKMFDVHFDNALFTPSFSLTTLDLSSISTGDHNIIAPILSASSQTLQTLTCFSLTGRHPNDLVEALPLVGATLKSLAFDDTGVKIPSTTFTSFIKLRSLNLMWSRNLPNIFASLSSSLQTLDLLGYSDIDDLEEEPLQVVQDLSPYLKKKCLSRLEQVRFGLYSMQDLIGVEGGREMLSALKEKGIEVVCMADGDESATEESPDASSDDESDYESSDEDESSDDDDELGVFDMRKELECFDQEVLREAIQYVKPDRRDHIADVPGVEELAFEIDELDHDTLLRLYRFVCAIGYSYS